MRIERTEILPFSIPFRRPFHAAGVKICRRTGLLILLGDDTGRIGIGEVSAHPLAPKDIIDRHFVEAIREATKHREFPDAGMPPAAWPGVEMASLDLQARRKGARLADLLGVVQRNRVPVNATLDRHEPREAGEQARRFVERGFVCIKIKLSHEDLSNDEARLAAIRAAAGKEVRLRIDANASWSVEQAVEAITRLEAHGLDYVEQPVARIDDLARVRRRVRTPIAADESVTGVAAVDALATAGAADLLVIKPTLLGLRTSSEIANRAAALGLGVVITSTLDTSIGIAAALHLAATLPNPLLPCGLATLDLLLGDLVSEPVAVRNGHMELPDDSGLGVQLDPQLLKRWGQEF